VTVEDVACDWHAGARTSETFDSFALCLVRRGVYELRRPGAAILVDSTIAYFEQRGIEQHVVHPRGIGGSTTVILMSDETVARHAGDVWLPDGPIPVTPQVHLLHAALVSDLRLGLDPNELDLRLGSLVGQLVECIEPGRLTARRPATRASHRRIVDRVREATAADPARLDLPALARELGHTTYHLSRVFHRATGLTLTAYRNRVRVAAAIDRIADGHDNLADMAVELGFFDQSHLVRVLRAAVGMPPARLQGWLGVSPSLRRRLDNKIQDGFSLPD
jgi:AraC-like DNA-binding protein